MIGSRYWSTGLALMYLPGHTSLEDGQRVPREWTARVDYFDDGFCEWRSTEGTLRLRYQAPSLSEAIDLIKADSERLGIDWKAPTIYAPGDGEDDDVHLPDDWRALIRAECDRLGWRHSYGEDDDR